MTNTRTMTAVFPFVRQAKEFTDRLGEKGQYASADEAWHYVPGSVRQSSYTVTWEWSGKGTDNFPDGSHNAYIQYLRDMLETVGYYGSPPRGKKATLNGVIAPPSY